MTEYAAVFQWLLLVIHELISINTHQLQENVIFWVCFAFVLTSLQLEFVVGDKCCTSQFSYILKCARMNVEDCLIWMCRTSVNFECREKSTEICIQSTWGKWKLPSCLVSGCCCWLEEVWWLQENNLKSGACWHFMWGISWQRENLYGSSCPLLSPDLLGTGT